MSEVSGEVVINLKTTKGNKTFRFGVTGQKIGNKIQGFLSGGGEEKLPWPLGKLRYEAVEGSLVSLTIIEKEEVT